MNAKWLALPLFTTMTVPIAQGAVDASSGFGRERNLRAATAAEVRERLFTWLDSQSVTPESRGQIESLWPIPVDGAEQADSVAPDLLDRLAVTFSLADERAASLVEHCRLSDATLRPHATEWLGDQQTAPFVRHNMRLWYGRWLAQRELYDESAAMLTDLEPTEVIDPATLLFYQGVVFQRLLAKEPGLKAIDALLEQIAAPPRRYVKLAELLKADLQQLEDESLDHIARRMENIERHLGLGRAGSKVRDIEDSVIASLDKLIKEAEDRERRSRRQPGAPSAGGPPNGNRSNKPAEESRAAQARGAGEVDPQEFSGEGGWGDLPPKERDEAMQQIGQDFPAHYRDVIEQYFRKLASDGREN